MRDYQKLYENIKAFHKLKPWEIMKDTDVVGIKYSDRKEPVFFALDGLDEDSIGLSVFRDVRNTSSTWICWSRSSRKLMATGNTLRS